LLIHRARIDATRLARRAKPHCIATQRLQETMRGQFVAPIFAPDASACVAHSPSACATTEIRRSFRVCDARLCAEMMNEHRRVSASSWNETQYALVVAQQSGTNSRCWCSMNGASACG
jgi:hypothetical protein